MARELQRRGIIRIREILTVDDPGFRDAHSLLRREFPRGEMLPLRDWRNAMRERREELWTDVAWHLLVAERDGEVVGAASASYLGNVNVMVVGYVAVREDARGEGLGPRLRRALRRKCDADARRVGHSHLKAVIGEVHAANPWLRSLVHREGAIALDFDYYQPTLGGGRQPVALVLYYQPLGAVRRSLSVAELRRLLYSIWRRAYRVPQPLARPAFRRMLRSLEGRRRVGQRAL
jgi:GNAT superfamily N-acetyltransferase